MGETIRVSSKKRVIEDGVEIILVAEDGREWTKHYPNEGEAGYELNEMGLVNHQTTQPSGFILSVHSHMKDAASIDVEVLERHGYVQRAERGAGRQVADAE